MIHLGKWFGFNSAEIFEEAVVQFELMHFDDAKEIFEDFLRYSPDSEFAGVAVHYIEQCRVASKREMRNGPYLC